MSGASQSGLAQAPANTLLEQYGAIESTSREMLAAARAGLWDEVTRLETACKAQIAQLERDAAGSELTRLEWREKMRIMLRLVEADAEVRRLAQPWQNRLDTIMAARGQRAGRA